MWTNKLYQLAFKETKPDRFLTGMYTVVTLPVQVKHLALLIINLRASNSGVAHWAVTYINNPRIGHYFDNLGNESSRLIIKFLQRNCKCYHINNIQYQVDQSVNLYSFTLM